MGDTLPNVADEYEDQKQDKIDELMLQMARGRVALGVSAFLAPALAARTMGGDGRKDPARDLVTRIFASREIALGAGYLLSNEAGRTVWARLGVLVDGLDTVAGLKSRKSGVPLWASGAFSAIAIGAVGIGGAKVAKDLKG